MKTFEQSHRTGERKKRFEYRTTYLQIVLLSKIKKRMDKPIRITYPQLCDDIKKLTSFELMPRTMGRYVNNLAKLGILEVTRTRGPMIFIQVIDVDLLEKTLEGLLKSMEENMPKKARKSRAREYARTLGGKESGYKLGVSGYKDGTSGYKDGVCGYKLGISENQLGTNSAHLSEDLRLPKNTYKYPSNMDIRYCREKEIRDASVRASLMMTRKIDHDLVGRINATMTEVDTKKGIKNVEAYAVVLAKQYLNVETRSIEVKPVQPMPVKRSQTPAIDDRVVTRPRGIDLLFQEHLAAIKSASEAQHGMHKIADSTGERFNL